MWLGQAAYIDEDDAPSVGRASTEEVEVMVLLDDRQWHREFSWQETACGVVIKDALDRRNKTYRGVLCIQCWTQRELDEAEANRRADEDELSDENDTTHLPSYGDLVVKSQRRNLRVAGHLQDIKRERER